MKEFLGIGGYTRPAEGAYSWQHLTFVGSLLVVMIFLGVFFGIRNRNSDIKRLECNTHILIRDSNDNRYEIEDYTALDRQSTHLLFSYI